MKPEMEISVLHCAQAGEEPAYVDSNKLHSPWYHQKEGTVNHFWMLYLYLGNPGKSCREDGIDIPIIILGHRGLPTSFKHCQISSLWPVSWNIFPVKIPSPTLPFIPCNSNKEHSVFFVLCKVNSISYLLSPCSPVFPSLVVSRRVNLQHLESYSQLSILWPNQRAPH